MKKSWETNVRNALKFCRCWRIKKRRLRRRLKLSGTSTLEVSILSTLQAELNKVMVVISNLHISCWENGKFVTKSNSLLCLCHKLKGWFYLSTVLLNQSLLRTRQTIWCTYRESLNQIKDALTKLRSLLEPCKIWLYLCLMN